MGNIRKYRDEYLALINHTDRLSLVNKMFIIWCQQEKFNLFNVTALY